MIEKIKALWIKYEEIIAYLIVGGLTTVVSWAAKFLANFLLFDNTMYPTPFQNIVLSIINWTAGVIFAYFTNRKYVFKSHAPMLSEAPKFVLCIHTDPGYGSDAGIDRSGCKSVDCNCDLRSTGHHRQLCLQ